MRKRFLEDESGFTLVELSVAMLMSAVIAAGMVAWLVQVANQDILSQQANDALAAMATAKAGVVKELRFAESVDLAVSNAHNVVFWSDEDGDGTLDPGETVTWSVQTNGDLVRYTDTTTPSVRVSHLVYDPLAGAGSTRFLFNPSDETVTIELTADVDSSAGPLPKSIRTEVHVRNA